MKHILINVQPYEKRVAVTTQRGDLEEFQIERKDLPRLAGNIYKGVIDSVVPGIGALFVDIGTGKNGFLYIKDLEEKAPQALLGEEIVVEKRSSRDKSFLNKLKKGQEVLVQVVKDPIGTKGPLITTDISLPGKYIVLMPFNDTMGISKKIADRQDRSKLKEVLKELKPPNRMGCIARTQSIGMKPRQLRMELKYLSNLWTRIQRRAEKQKAPSLIFEEYDLPLRIIRDYFDNEMGKILVDSKEEYKAIHRFASSINPHLTKKIFYYKGKTPLYEKYNIESQIEGVFRRKVFLKSGGFIVIEQTEGLMAIDVNTGKFTGKKNPEQTVFKTNMEAANEIAKQIMLRDISGIIVIDFIDMADKANRRRVHEALQNALKADKAKIKILSISPIGLVEMTRQRVRKSLESLSFRDCPYCNGMGRIKTPATIAIEAMRSLERIMSEKRTREIKVVVHPDVASHVENTYSNVLRQLERRFRKKISLNSDPKIHVENVYFE